MNGLALSNDSLREANRARKQVLLAELDRIQAQKAAVEQQLAALNRGPAKATGGVKKRPSKGVPLEDLRPDKRPKIQTEWNKKEQQVWLTCSSILKGLTKGSFSHVFMQPVNTEQFRDYTKYVKKPMDLGTITKKLNSKPRAYKDPAHFRDDVRQVWENCKQYNAPEAPVGKAGLGLSEKFEKDWTRNMVEDKWKQIQLGKQQDALVSLVFRIDSSWNMLPPPLALCTICEDTVLMLICQLDARTKSCMLGAGYTFSFV